MHSCSFLIGRGPRAAMTRECIPTLRLLNSKNSNHSFNLAPSIAYSRGGEGGGRPPQNYSDPRINKKRPYKFLVYGGFQQLGEPLRVSTEYGFPRLGGVCMGLPSILETPV